MKRNTKQLSAAVIALCAFLLGLINIAAETDIAAVSAQISSLDAISKKIADKEAQLASLKARSGGSDIWNFIGRRNQELAVQKRIQLAREISDLAEESRQLLAGLLAARPEVCSRAAAEPSDADLEQAAAWLDKAAADEAMAYEYLDKESISKASEQFLGHRHSVQADKIRSLEGLLDSLRARFKALKASGKASEAARTEVYIDMLGERLGLAKKSQEYISKALKKDK